MQKRLLIVLGLVVNFNLNLFGMFRNGPMPAGIPLPVRKYEFKAAFGIEPGATVDIPNSNKSRKLLLESFSDSDWATLLVGGSVRPDREVLNSYYLGNANICDRQSPEVR